MEQATVPVRSPASIRAMMSLSGINILIAVVLVAIPFFVPVATAAAASMVLVGVLVLALEIFDAWAEANARFDAIVAPAVGVVLLGLWSIGYALVAAAPATYLVVSVIAGIVLVATAGSNALTGRSRAADAAT